MQPLDVVEAIAVPMPAADINTDQILPARFMHKPRDDYGRYCFRDLRFDPAGQPNPVFVLNQPAYRGARILVAGANFACGSSREHAVFTLADYGFRVIVAASFGDIFFINCFKNGMLPVVAPADFVQRVLQHLAAHPGAHMRVELTAQQVFAPDGSRCFFDIDGFRKDCLLRGLDELDVTLALRNEINAFEARRDAVSVFHSSTPLP